MAVELAVVVQTPRHEGVERDQRQERGAWFRQYCA